MLIYSLNYYDFSMPLLFHLTSNGDYVLDSEGIIPSGRRGDIQQATVEDCKGQYEVHHLGNHKFSLVKINGQEKIILKKFSVIVADNSSSSNSSSSKKESKQETLDAFINRYFSDTPNFDRMKQLVLLMKASEHIKEIDIEGKNKHQSRELKDTESRGSKNNTPEKSYRRKIIATNEKFSIKGYVQSGKTRFMQQFALLLFLHFNCSSVIVFRQMGDLIQFKTRLIEEQKRYEQAASEYKGNLNTKQLQFETVTNDRKIKNFAQTMVSNPPKIYLVLGNAERVNTINESFKQVLREGNSNKIFHSYALFIDESDYVDSPGSSAKADKLSVAKNFSHTVFLVSATVIDNIAEEKIYPENIVLIEPTSSYRGIPSFDVHLTPSTAKFSNYVGDNLLQTDPELINCLDDFVADEPKIAHTQGESMPCIMLVNIGKTVEPQHKAVSVLRTRYSQVVFIVYTGDGLTICGPGLPSNPFVIEGIKSTIKNGNHTFKGIVPEIALLWLKRNGGAHKFPHICFFSGDLAGRSISYACKDSDGSVWHLTHHRLVLSKSTTEAGVIQKCRMCTIFETPMPLKLYCSEEDKNSIIKSYYKQEEIIKRIKASPSNILARDVMQNLCFNVAKRCAKRKLGNSSSAKVKYTSRSDGGMNADEYKFESSPIYLHENEEKERDENEEKEEKEEKREEKIENVSVQPANQIRIHKVIMDKIREGTISREKFDKIIQKLKETMGSWISRAQLIDKITKNNTVKGHYRSTLHPDNMSAEQHTIVTDETIPGLLMKQSSSNNWMLRYNAE